MAAAAADDRLSAPGRGVCVCMCVCEGSVPVAGAVATIGVFFFDAGRAFFRRRRRRRVTRRRRFACQWRPLAFGRVSLCVRVCVCLGRSGLFS